MKPFLLFFLTFTLTLSCLFSTGDIYTQTNEKGKRKKKDNKNQAKPLTSAKELEKALDELQFTTPLKRLKAVDFSLYDLNGKKYSLKKLQGKVVLLYFWATWCPPCMEDMQELQKLYNVIKKKDFLILAVSSREVKTTVSAFIKSKKYSFPVLLDKTGKIAELYSANMIPTSYIITKDNNILARAIGPRNWNGKTAKSLFFTLVNKRFTSKTKPK